ncbi:MAG: hypothetical protein KAU14_00660, partial [Thermoplasmata archaeon]|nr:hypothetical protein [Thermoplasmata archaeon]
MLRQKLTPSKALVFLTILVVLIILILTSNPATGEGTDAGKESEAPGSGVWLAFDEGAPVPPETNIRSCDTTHIELDLTLHGAFVQQKRVEGPDGNKGFRLITIPDNGYLSETGRPQLPAIRVLLIVPSNKMEAGVLDIEEFMLSGYTIYPAQPPTTDYSGTPEFTIDEGFYSTNGFFPEDIVEIASTGTIRDYRIVQLQFNPVRFNPVTNEVRVYNHARIELRFGGSFVVNEGNRNKKSDERSSSPFETIYK